MLNWILQDILRRPYLLWSFGIWYKPCFWLTHGSSPSFQSLNPPPQKKHRTWSPFPSQKKPANAKAAAWVMEKGLRTKDAYRAFRLAYLGRRGLSMLSIREVVILGFTHLWWVANATTVCCVCKKIALFQTKRWKFRENPLNWIRLANYKQN